jgi:MYND finger
VNIATAELSNPLHAGARSTYPPWALEQIDRSAECAMQLVRLGADPTRKLHLGNAPATMHSQVYRIAGFDGKSALELARLTARKDLVELMEQHLRYSPKERAEAVHCRCGSRLPWRACHSTGIGQPSHYFVHQEHGLLFRVSPLARCPCRHTARTYYECCWMDTSRPAYLIDADGESVHMELIRAQSTAGRALLAMRDQVGGGSLSAGMTEREFVAAAATLLRSSGAMSALFVAEGPKSQIVTWDPDVYAGCLERLESGFFWKDLHWRLDKSELLCRTDEWNEALQKYCDDAGLVGGVRETVVAKHTANPCAPCGRVGCDAFERDVREFQRCSRCKSIAYCGRACQKLDWAEHRKTCG